MNYRQLGHSTLDVSAICLGSMTWGQQNTEAEAHSQLDFAAERGINFIDTAEMYPVPPREQTYTRTEAIIGNWLQHQPRDKWIIASKAAGPRRGFTWIRQGETSFTRHNLRTALEASLKRLKTDYLDLYQLHWPDRHVPLFGQYQFDPSQDTPSLSIHAQLEALAGFVKEGKIRYIGVSNETAWGLMQFVHLANQYDLPRIVSVQNAYSLISRSFEFGLSEIAHREHLSLLAYSPLAFGHLSGKYLNDPNTAGRITEFSGFGQRYEKPNVIPAVTAYAALARQHGMTPAQMALAFVYHRWFVTSTIIGASSLAQLKETLPAMQTPMSPDILADIDAIHLRYTNPAP